MSTNAANTSSSGARAGLGIGFAMGLFVGLGMFTGAWCICLWRPASIVGPEIPLHAVATDRGDTFSIATGPITEGVEGIFCLDFLTGDLQCWVLNNRTNVVAGYFAHNVVVDLGGDVTRKNPQYLMVTGMTGLRGGGGAMRPSECAVYVADAHTGSIVGYAIPWDRNLASRGAQANPLVPIFRQQARNLQIRGQ